MGFHHTVLNFGIELEHGCEPVASYPQAAEVDRQSSFIFTSDALVKPAPQLKTASQRREATHMEVLMTDRLCRATTGDHCPAV